jgi:hypothetical protein
MGIYASDNIFGIRIYNFNDDDIGITLFEEKYDEIMSHEQLRQARLFYDLLYDKKNIHFKIYTECSSTLSNNKETFMEWHVLSLDTFLEKFSIC